MSFMESQGGTNVLVMIFLMLLLYADQQMINSLSSATTKSLHSRTGCCDRIAASTSVTS